MRDVGGDEKPSPQPSRVKYTGEGARQGCLQDPIKVPVFVSLKGKKTLKIIGKSIIFLPVIH
jgi:hypothetical protein